MPCIYRRAALHRIGLDQEVYGVNVCQGGVDMGDSGSEAPDDFRASLSFLNRNPTQNEIARMLVVNGRLAPNEALAHAATVSRAMDEIMALLNAKATPEIRRLAGLMRRHKS
jgi:hypothetical protein